MRVGTIGALARYPVKSMGGEGLEEAEVGWQGIVGDRRHAFVLRRSRGTFPWLTGRRLPKMLGYGARFDAAGERVEVRTPDGAVLPVDDPRLLEELERECGSELWPLAQGRGSFDVAPVSIIAASSIEAVAAASDTPPAPRRFRMNLYVTTDDPAAYPERAWVGRVLRVGETVRVAVTEPDRRCVMITLPQPGIAHAPEVLRAVAKLPEAALGVYAVVLTTGVVRVGDPVVLEP